MKQIAKIIASIQRRLLVLVEVGPFRSYLSLFRRRIVARLGVLAVLAGFVASSLGAVVSTPVYADTSLGDNVTKLLQIGAVSECLAHWAVEYNEVNAGDRQRGLDQEVVIGHFVTKKNNSSKGNCKEVIPQATKALGYSDVKDLLKAAGFTEKNGDASTFVFKDKGNFSGTKTVTPKIIQNLKSATKISPTKAEYYVLFYNTFTTVCSSSPIEGAAKGSDAWTLAEQAKDNYVLVDVVDGNGELTTTVYGNARLDTRVDVANKYLWLKSGSSASSNFSCAEIAKATRNNSAEYKAYQQDRVDRGEDADSSTNGGESLVDDSGASTCTVDGIGWIVCPVATVMSNIVDSIYSSIITPMLRVPALNTATDLSSNEGMNNNLYKAWVVIRDISNVAFIVVFLFVIYSQITGFGLNNYSIKKMAPKLIIGAILLNLSYWICALGVDLSNALGYGLQDMLGYMFDSTLDNSNWQAVVGALLAGTGTAAIVAGGVTATIAIGAGAAAGTALLWFVVPILIGAVLAVVVAALVLALRQALIVVLIVISPLAIVAYLLPNTESWFDKWRKAFVSALVFFPLFSLVFGGSQVAAAVLIGASGSNTDISAPILLICGMIAQVFPLFSAPFILKASSGFLGSVAAKLQGGISKITSPVGKFARGRAGASLGLARQQALAGSRSMHGGVGNWRRHVGSAVWGGYKRSQRTNMQTEASKAAVDAGLAEAVAQDAGLSDLDIETRANKERTSSAGRVSRQNYIDWLAAGGSSRAAGIDPGGATRIQAAAEAEQAKEMAEAIKNIELTAKIAPGDITAMRQAYASAVQGGDSVGARAYQNMMYRSGAPGHKAWQEATEDLEDTGALSTEMRRDLAENITENHSKMKSTNNAAMTWAVDSTQSASLREHENDAGTYSKLTNEELISQKAFVQQKAIDLGVVDVQRARDIEKNRAFDTMSEDVKRQIRDIARGAAQSRSSTSANGPG